MKALVGLLALVVVSFEVAGKTDGKARTTINMIILHTIGGPKCSPDNKSVIFDEVKGSANLWKKWFDEHATLGIHWIVDRDGVTRDSTKENVVANHAPPVNESSIGIELVNKGDGRDTFPPAQIDALVSLIRSIRQRWNIPVENIKRHADVDNGPRLPCGSPRRIDPPVPPFPFEEVIRRVK